MSRPSFPPEADEIGQWAMQRFHALGGQALLPLTITVAVIAPDGTEYEVSLKWWPGEADYQDRKPKKVG